MPRSNLRILFLVLLLCAFCSGRASYRDWTLIDSARKIRNEALVGPSEAALFEAAMDGMTRRLREDDDRWSQYIAPRDVKEFNEMLFNRIEGIGVLFQPGLEKGEYTIFYPIHGSPAYQAGIRAGDRILAVDGTSTENLEFDEVRSRIRGEPNSSVTLTVRSVGEEKSRDVVVRREQVVSPSVLGETLNEDGSLRLTLADEPRIAYVNLTSGFTDTTADEMGKALRALPPEVEALILDLRNNPGGFIDTCVQVADMFVKPTGGYEDIVQVKRRNGKIKSRYKATEHTLYDKPVYVLVDRGSASASEILAACLQDFHRAKVFGTRSYGKGTVQETHDLPMQFGILKLTNAGYWRPSGKNIHRFKDAPETAEWGVSPDPLCEFPVERIDAAFAAQVRSYRSHVPGADKDLARVVEELIRRFRDFDPELLQDEEASGEDETETVEEPKTPEETESDGKTPENETPAEPVKPFSPQGEAPYYDPLLSEAIKHLKAELDGQSIEKQVENQNEDLSNDSNEKKQETPERK